MIEQHFKFIIYKWMIDNMFYFINLKAKSSCHMCLEGKALNDSHSCWELAPQYHTRAHLLLYYTEAYFAILDVLEIPSVLDDLQGLTQILLLNNGHSLDSVKQINTTRNIKEVVFHDQDGMTWIFNEFWQHHPDAIATITPPMPLLQGMMLPNEPQLDQTSVIQAADCLTETAENIHI